MTHRNVYASLNFLGLKDTEARVYVAFVSEGPSTVAHIATTLNMERTALYPLIHSLSDKGFVVETYVGLKKRYSAMPPEQLENMVDLSRAEIKKIIPELVSLQTRARSDAGFKVFHGLKGVKTYFESVLKMLEPRDFYYVISNSSNFISADPDYFSSFIKRRSEMDIDLRLLLEDNEENKKILAQHPVLRPRTRVFPSSTTIAASKTITPHTFSTYQSVPPVHIIATENKHIINLERTLFELLWDCSV